MNALRTRSRRAVAVLVVLLTAGLALSACSGGSNAVVQSDGAYHFVSATKIGTLIPEADRKPIGDVTGSLLAGGTFNLNNDIGHVTVINFWATWCGPCTTETPEFDALYRQVKSQGVDFVGIDTKETNRDAPEAFVKDNNISYPIVFDQNGQVAVEIGKIPLLALPDTVVIDKQHRVAAVYFGELTTKDLSPVLSQLIAET